MGNRLSATLMLSAVGGGLHRADMRIQVGEMFKPYLFTSIVVISELAHKALIVA